MGMVWCVREKGAAMASPSLRQWDYLKPGSAARDPVTPRGLSQARDQIVATASRVESNLASFLQATETLKIDQIG